MIRVLKDKDNLFVRLGKAVALLAVMVALLFSATTVAFADEDKTDKDFSFYKVASAASAYYDDTHNGASDNSFVNEDITMARAGAFVGFVDEDYDSGFFGSTISFLSGSSQSRGYDAFDEPGMKAYVQYGHALQAMGLDSTANETFDIAAIVRWIGGLFLFVGYTLALLADVFFGAIIKILQTFNPFAWFMVGAKGVSEVFAKFFGVTTKPDNWAGFDGLSQFISGWYEGLSNFGMYLIVLLFFVSLAITLILWKSQQGKMKSVFRLFVTRLLFICVGIPLLGGLYTMSLDACADISIGSGKTPAADQILMATLVDFEAWASNGNLSLPVDMDIKVDVNTSSAGEVDEGQSDNPRTLARRINSCYSNLGSNRYNSDWNQDLTWTSDDLTESDKVFEAWDIIGRYMSSAFYHASDYETAYKKDYLATPDDNATKSAALYKTIKDNTGNRDKYSESDLFEKSEETRYGDPDSEDTFYAPYLTDNTSIDVFGVTQDDSSITYHGGSYTGQVNGLSSLSMYNYLTTSFDDSSVVTFSTKKATSGLVVKAHRSVNLIGGGAMSILYYANSMSMFFAIIIIGLVYSIGLLFNMLGRGIKMVTSVPFAMLGNMRAMAKVTTYVAMMIIEVLGTFFVYSLVIEILISLSGLVETPLLEVLNDSVSSTMLAGGTPMLLNPAAGAIRMVGLLMSTVVYLVFGLKAIRWRKSIIKTMDEAVAGVIDRIFTVDAQGGSMSNAGNAGSAVATRPTLGERATNAGKQVAGSVAAGVGMAAGQKLTNDVLDKASGVAGTILGASGSAENPGGAGDDVKDGTGIEGAERQGLPGTDANGNPVGGGPSPISDETAGRRMVEAHADSLGNIRSGDEADVPVTQAQPTSDTASISATDMQEVEAGESARKVDVTATAAEADQMHESKGVSKSDKKQLAADTDVDRMTGQTTAMEDMADDEAKRQVKKEARKEVAAGAVQTAKGVAEGAAAYASGDAQMGVDAAKDIAKGSQKMAKAGDKSANAGADVAAVRAQKTEARKVQQARTQSGSAQQVQKGQPAGGGGSGQGTPVVNSVSTSHGGSSSQVVQTGPTNVSVKGGSAMSPETRQKLSRLQAEQKTLERARAQVRQTGKAVLPDGRVIRNEAQVNSAMRANMSAQSSLKGETAKKAGKTAKKVLTNVATGGKDGDFI